MLVRRGVYAERDVVKAVDRYDGALGLRDRAAHLTMTRPHLMSHDSAARAHGLAMLRPEQDLVHITRFGVGGSRTEEGVKHHLTRLGLLSTTVIDTMRVTGVARTALDIGREHGFQHGVVACDAAMQLGVDVADLESELVPMTCWPGRHPSESRRRRGRSGSRVSRGRHSPASCFSSSTSGRPRRNFRCRCASRVFWADLRIGCHLFEFDGKRKFLRRANGGVAGRPVEEILWDEKRRQDDICAQGLGMSRVTWAEVFGSSARGDGGTTSVGVRADTSTPRRPTARSPRRFRRGPQAPSRVHAFDTREVTSSTAVTRGLSSLRRLPGEHSATRTPRYSGSTAWPCCRTPLGLRR